ncbi:V-type ATP synthase subunit E [Cellulosilyticum sp. I15G10I2]|uniref:V-type ATP synthase subunit E n=1 Tax=Cellulosilyticum sp. I15G10I2 TaxID=1892843 RepID=UPI00085C2717|nr:V-type ATP synthase subunit E [Cellulosilyticum sp. I15G10I2]
MVTIEQKLTLFSKLLHQDIKEEVENKLAELDKEYKRRIIRNKDKVDKEANMIIENAKKRAELKKIEIISKSKISAKREVLLTKEKYINMFIGHFEAKIKSFTQTEAYKNFLKGYLMQFKEIKDYKHDLVVYMTEWDYAHHKDYIKEILINLELDAQKLSFEIINDTILGGVIIVDPVFNMRIDASIAALLQDSKNYIIESLFTAIGEVGGTLE